ncbi:hypothetical protein [Halovivax ruber]|uniref:hypothetical protein n=1 Tax=Halovivax ruber TaxID=387341 RepID=UPI0011E4E6C5|nr:hypothetical protein [Halovivax ruber]
MGGDEDRAALRGCTALLENDAAFETSTDEAVVVASHAVNPIELVALDPDENTSIALEHAFNEPIAAMVSTLATAG